MRVAVPHGTTRSRARQIVEQKLKNLETHYGNQASDVEHEWQGDTLHVSGKAKGFHLSGTLEITETEVIIDGKLPLLARAFEGKIKHTVEREAQSMFRTA